MDKYITKFSLACLTLNCMLIKIFIDTPLMLMRDAGSGAVTALWLSAAVGIIIILFAFFLRNYITAFLQRKSVFKIFSCIVFAYFVCLDIYLLYKVINTIHLTVYHEMPISLILILIMISMLFIGTKDVYSITRLHSICVPVIAICIIAVALSGIKYTELLNAVPIFGNGLDSVFSISLKHLFAFSEIIVPVLIILISAHNEKDKETKKSKFPSAILIAACIGILIYSAVITIFLLTVSPTSNSGTNQLPIYYLSRFSAAGRLNARTDALYALILIASAVLFLGSTLNIIISVLKKLGFSKRFKPRYAALILVLIFSSMTLCSCHDAQEVEDTAFAIAIGVDVNQNSDDALSFTFQFSNPLATGQNTNTGEDEKSSETEAEGSDTSEDKKNSSVDNIKVEADSFLEALNRITNHMGKTPSLAHVKLVVLSEELIFSSQPKLTKAVCSDLLKADEVRPEASVCIVKDNNASEYLTSVNPSLEESTARHYELMFNKNSTFDSVQTNLRTFSMRLSDDASDAYAPLVTNDGFEGTVLFSGDKAATVIDSQNSRLMNIILGNAKSSNLFYTDNSGNQYRLKQSYHPKFYTDIKNNSSKNEYEINSVIKLSINAEAVDKNITPNAQEELKKELCEKSDKLLAYSYSNNADIFQIGKSAKSKLKYEYEWNSLKQYVPIYSYNVTSQIDVTINK